MFISHLVFRGGWCPYCNVQLGQLKEIEKELVALGFQIVAISTDKPEILKAHAEENNFSYTVVSDAEMTAAKALGIAFKVDDETFNKYKSKFKIDLEEFSGFDHHLLPVPSVFIVDKEGVIQFSYVNPDYKTRLSSKVLLAAAKALKE